MTPSQPLRGSLALLGIPSVFVQDGLLDTEAFIRSAKERGNNISLETLQALHRNGLLVPLFRITDVAVEGWRVAVHTAPDTGSVILDRVMDAARAGRLRDPAEEGYSAAWPYRKPEGSTREEWWNGFVYSSWQLVDLGWALTALSWTEGRHLPRSGMAADRRRTIALAALSPRHLSSILRRTRSFPGTDVDTIRRFRSDKFESEWAAGNALTPVVRVLSDVQRILYRISGIRAMEVPSGFSG